MLYALVTFSDQFSPLNVFRYITFRTGGAIMPFRRFPLRK
jgi:phospho-N-acetylmuramoyl-pentapeptide-transferase